MVKYLQNIDFINPDSSTAFIYYNDQNVLYISTALQLNLDYLDMRLTNGSQFLKRILSPCV